MKQPAAMFVSQTNREHEWELNSFLLLTLSFCSNTLIFMVVEHVMSENSLYLIRIVTVDNMDKTN